MAAKKRPAAAAEGAEAAAAEETAEAEGAATSRGRRRLSSKTPESDLAEGRLAEATEQPEQAEEGKPRAAEHADAKALRKVLGTYSKLVESQEILDELLTIMRSAEGNEAASQAMGEILGEKMAALLHHAGAIGEGSLLDFECQGHAAHDVLEHAHDAESARLTVDLRKLETATQSRLISEATLKGLEKHDLRCAPPTAAELKRLGKEQEKKEKAAEREAAKAEAKAAAQELKAERLKQAAALKAEQKATKDAHMASAKLAAEIQLLTLARQQKPDDEEMSSLHQEMSVAQSALITEIAENAKVFTVSKSEVDSLVAKSSRARNKK